MKRLKVSLIVAMDQKRGIGKNNQLLFRIPEDMKRFRQLTTGHPVIMGRKTFESIGRVLPNRTNIIVTRDTTYVVEEAVMANSLEQAMQIAKETEEPKGPEGEIFIIGGGQIYAQAINLADKLYLAIVEGTYGADTFFPEYEDKGFNVVREEKRESEGYKYTFLELER